MGHIAGAAIGAAGDVAAAGMTTSASILNTNSTNQANRDIANVTNASNERNVAATNKANMQIAQMNNEYNERQLDKQIQTQWDMWNAENEYNDPSAQMQRYRDAGINPYMATGQISSGTASSMTAPSANTADPSGMQQAAQAQMGAPMQTTDFSGLQGLRGVARNFIDLINAQEDTKGKQLDNQNKEIENTYKADMFKVEMYKKMLDAGLTKRQIKGLDIENRFKPQLMSSELQLRKTQNMYTRLQAQGQMIANLSALEWYKVLPTQIQQAITEKMVDINNKRLSGRLTSAQIETEIHKGMNEMLKYQYGVDTFNINRKKLTFDLLNSLYGSAGDGLNFLTRRYNGSEFNDLFGFTSEKDGYNPDFWNK